MKNYVVDFEGYAIISDDIEIFDYIGNGDGKRLTAAQYESLPDDEKQNYAISFEDVQQNAHDGLIGYINHKYK